MPGLNMFTCLVPIFKTILALLHVTLLSGSVRLQWWSSVALQLEVYELGAEP